MRKCYTAQLSDRQTGEVTKQQCEHGMAEINESRIWEVHVCTLYQRVWPLKVCEILSLKVGKMDSVGNSLESTSRRRYASLWKGRTLLMETNVSVCTGRK